MDQTINQIVSALGNPTLQWVGAIFFALAVLHTLFLVSVFQRLAKKYPEGSVGENLFHLLGEAEAVFGLWATAFAVMIIGVLGVDSMKDYINTRNYTEPLFVFAIMCMAATRPVIELTGKAIEGVANILPMPKKMAFYATALIVGPLLGSFITEPAAMTVTAMVLLDRYFARNVSMKFRYVTIALLFLNISVGGTLTNFAAPAVLMVAAPWGWTTGTMAGIFGYKSAIAIVVCTIAATAYLSKEFATLEDPPETGGNTMSIPFGVTLLQILLIGGVVFFAHDVSVFMGIFLIFLAIYKVTREYHDDLKLVESLLVAAFLGGLVTLGGMQEWWLTPVLTKLGEIPMFFGAFGLTMVTDNAALTYLATLVDGLGDPVKVALMTGAVAGGGMTIIANAPNPAGYSILKNTFDPKEGLNPVKLILASLPFTIFTVLCIWFLPNLAEVPPVPGSVPQEAAVVQVVESAEEVAAGAQAEKAEEKAELAANE